MTGLWESIQQGRTTSLYAGSEEDLCAEQGADYYWNGFECVYAPGSPIIISTAKSKKYKLTSVEAGVLFDIDGDGFIDRVAWTEAKDDVAFLALDRDGDGQITSGRELFGNHTLPGIRHGFAALAQMAFESSGERRGSVSSDDPLFAKLLLWTDRNHDGQSDVSELQPAAEIVSQIGLGYGVELTNFDNHGNWFRLKGWAHVRSGPGKNESKSGKDNEDRTRDIWDVFLKVQRP